MFSVRFNSTFAAGAPPRANARVTKHVVARERKPKRNITLSTRTMPGLNVCTQDDICVQYVQDVKYVQHVQYVLPVGYSVQYVRMCACTSMHNCTIVIEISHLALST